MSDLKQLEEALASAALETYELRLYVTGQTLRSSRAIENLHAICERLLPGRYELTVIDLFENPEKAQEQDVIAAPTLVKTLPLPIRKLIGDLADENRVLLALNLSDSRS